MKLYTENMQVNIPIYQAPVSVLKLDELNGALSAEKKLPVNSQSEQVNVSEEARQKSADDTNQVAMRKIMGKEDVNEVEGEGKRTLDEKIAELQEKITKLTAEIAQERRSGNNEKLKTMESELVMLNSQLLQLIEQKMEAAKSQ
jgi:hypothetical protein